jgi:CheY-like chemotaxis protein
MMPVLDAAALCDLMRVDHHLAHIPVVVLSAAYGAEEAARRLGAAGCLPKPFELDDLVDTVQRVAGEPTPLPVQRELATLSRAPQSTTRRSRSNTF